MSFLLTSSKEKTRIFQAAFGPKWKVRSYSSLQEPSISKESVSWSLTRETQDIEQELRERTTVFYEGSAEDVAEMTKVFGPNKWLKPTFLTRGALFRAVDAAEPMALEAVAEFEAAKSRQTLFRHKFKTSLENVLDKNLFQSFGREVLESLHAVDEPAPVVAVEQYTTANWHLTDILSYKKLVLALEQLEYNGLIGWGSKNGLDSFEASQSIFPRQTWDGPRIVSGWVLADANIRPSRLPSVLKSIAPVYTRIWERELKRQWNPAFLDHTDNFQLSTTWTVKNYLVWCAGNKKLEQLLQSPWLRIDEDELVLPTAAGRLLLDALRGVDLESMGSIIVKTDEVGPSDEPLHAFFSWKNGLHLAGKGRYTAMASRLLGRYTSHTELCSVKPCSKCKTKPLRAMADRYGSYLHCANCGNIKDQL